MKLSEFKRLLANHPDKNVRFELPTGSKFPAHAHVTEVARIDKRYIDCGGTKRTDSACRLQTWFADDTDHRLVVAKLLGILDKAAPLLETEDIEIDVECEAPFIAHFPVAGIEADDDIVLIRLGIKHTACLAEDKCGISQPPQTVFSIGTIPSLTPATKCC